jgi:hypothetical protein
LAVSGSVGFVVTVNSSAGVPCSLQSEPIPKGETVNRDERDRFTEELNKRFQAAIACFNSKNRNGRTKNRRDGRTENQDGRIPPIPPELGMAFKTLRPPPLKRHKPLPDQKPLF